MKVQNLHENVRLLLSSLKPLSVTNYCHVTRLLTIKTHLQLVPNWKELVITAWVWNSVSIVHYLYCIIWAFIYTIATAVTYSSFLEVFWHLHMSQFAKEHTFAVLGVTKFKNYETYNNERKEQVFASRNKFQIKKSQIASYE